jgi:hypothetical protein
VATPVPEITANATGGTRVVGTFPLVLDEQSEGGDQQVPRSFGWTSSRATHVYFVWHAPLDELLEHLGLEPLPDSPPPAPELS